jgi:hypothetical protein
MQFYNLWDGIRSQPFDTLAEAQAAAHDFVIAALQNGARFTVETVDQSNRIITEFSVIEVIM